MNDHRSIWNPCVECGAYELKPFVDGVTKVDPARKYLVYNEPDREWDIAQWDEQHGWETTIREDSIPVTHYQELPR